MIIENMNIKLKDFILNVPYLDLNSSITLISGQNGTGKSTLLKSILGLHPTNINIEKKEFGYVPQDYRMTLLPWLNAKENLQLFNSSYELIKKLLDVGFSKNDLIKYPRLLSGGQCQRIAIIRESSMNIDFLILDEPFSGLDKMTIPKIGEIIKESIYNGTKIILTSHIKLPENLTDIDDFKEVYIERTKENIATLKLEENI